MKKLIGYILLILVVCCSLIPLNALAAGDVPQAVLDLRRSVVRIVCQTSDGTYTGSGFAIGTDEPVKYIVTNLHVVVPNPNGVTILRENNREVPAKVYLEIENADLCVLLLGEELYGVPPVRLQDGKNASVGQAVYALGFPGAADIISDTISGKPEDVTITDGIVSAVKSFTYIEKGTPIDLLQINAAISHGNSGGPLVDEKGSVLGINSLGVTDAQNINGAVSILELTSALKERGIPFLSSEEKASGFPVLTIAIVAGSVVLAALMIRRAKKGKKSATVAAETPLPEYLRNWGGRLPYDMAARLLAPALRDLAAQHQAGRVHGDICPENIAVNPAINHARLNAPEANTGLKIVLRPGYSSPEQYRADGRIGPWSDVYSLCAVFYYVVTGNAPLGVMERLALSGGKSISFDEANIDQVHGSALLAGLAPDAAQRPQNAVELANSLGIGLTPAPQEAAPVAAAVTQTNATKPPKKRMGKKLLIAGLATLFVLCAGAGGYYLYNDSEYNKAVECIRKQDYKGGIDNLAHVLRIFKESEAWMSYACAGNALQQNQFESARHGFIQLGTFNGSDKMLKEADYLEAHYLLSKEQYQKAKLIFAALSGYKDSDQMIHEVDYQKAKQLLNERDYLNAIGLFKMLAELKYKDSNNLISEANYRWAISLYEEQKYIESVDTFKTVSDYRDTQKYLELVLNEMSNKAISLYRSGQYKNAESLFVKIGEYYDTSAYLDLISAHLSTQLNSLNSYSQMKGLYKRLSSLGSFEDAQQLLSTDLFLLYRLEGIWSDSGHKNSIGLVHGTSWIFVISLKGSKTTTLPWSYDFVIHNNKISDNVGTCWFAFNFYSANRIRLVLLEHLSFTMTKQ